MIILMTQAAVEVGLIGALMAIATSLVSKKIVDQNKMKEMKKRISDFQKRYAEAKKRRDQAEIKKLEAQQGEIIRLTKEMMITGLKPMAITFIPIIIVISIMNEHYGAMGNIIEVPIFGQLSWFWWYFIVIILTGIIVELIYRGWKARGKTS